MVFRVGLSPIGTANSCGTAFRQAEDDVLLRAQKRLLATRVDSLAGSSPEDGGTARLIGREPVEKRWKSCDSSGLTPGCAACKVKQFRGPADCGWLCAMARS